MSTTRPNCAVCNNPESKYCTGCRRIAYCSRDCQKKGWKAHKKECFPKDAVCTRCAKTIIADENLTTCRVPHPAHLVQDRGSSFGGGTMSQDESCSGCNRCYTKSASLPPGAISAPGNGDPVWTYSPARFQWCYEGPHTVKTLLTSDQRRVSNDIVNITLDGNVQEKIDALKPDTRILTIKSGTFFNDEITPVLNKKLPNLEEIHLIDIAFSEVVLDSQTSPKLETVELQNIPDDCNMMILSENLKNVDIRYFHGDCAWVDKMLRVATKLENFRSYKLGVDAISFASNKLQEIHLHRSDCLLFIEIYGPSLTHLRLQGCYSLERLTLVDTHSKLTPRLPAGHAESTIEVDTTNSCLSPELSQMLDSHPRIEWFGEEVDEMAGVGGMESMFMNMNQMMGGDYM